MLRVQTQKLKAHLPFNPIALNVLHEREGCLLSSAYGFTYSVESARLASPTRARSPANVNSPRNKKEINGAAFF